MPLLLNWTPVVYPTLVYARPICPPPPPPLASDKNGEVLFRDAFNSAVSAVLIADYRMDGQEEVSPVSLKVVIFLRDITLSCNPRLAHCGHNEDPIDLLTLIALATPTTNCPICTYVTPTCYALCSLRILDISPIVTNPGDLLRTQRGCTWIFANG